MIATAVSPQLEIAHRLVGSGVGVIPIGRNKQPAIAWKEFQSRLATPVELQDWFGVPDRFGIGIPCGSVSGNLEVIDFDVQHPEDLKDAWDCFISNVVAGCPDFPLDALSLVKTPRGLHLYYRCDSPVGGSQKLARHNGILDPESGEFRNPGYFIETRGEGGYVLSVGSPAHCHPIGGKYQVIGGTGIHELRPITAEHQGILLKEARWIGVQDTKAEAQKESVSVSTAHQGSAGLDFASRTSWSEILLPAGFTLVETTTDETQHWRRPGTTNPVSATTNHDGSDKFYAFSPNCGYGIESNRGYSKFAIFTMLNHAGDFSASAKALGQMGFGSQRDLSHIDISKVLEAEEPKKEEGQSNVIRPIGIIDLVHEHPSLSEPLVEGVFRRGETCNVIAATKAGKSWLTYGMALSIATGKPWLNHFRCTQGRVLMIDNELHPSTLAYRIPLAAKALGISPASYGANLDIVSLRGRIQGLDQIGNNLIKHLRFGEYDAIFLDAWYRAIPSGKGENDNSAMAEAFNLVDRYAAYTGASWILVHHSTKGDQADKRVTDVGSGAGSQSRAADTHMIFREHQEENCVTLEAAVRSFPPLKPITMRWEFPIWTFDESLDPKALKRSKTRQESKQELKDADGCQLLLSLLEHGPETRRAIQERCGMGRERVNRLLRLLLDCGKVSEIDIEGKPYIQLTKHKNVADVLTDG